MSGSTEINYLGDLLKYQICSWIILPQKFLADTIKSSEVEVEARKGYAVLYDKQHTSCSDW